MIVGICISNRNSCAVSSDPRRVSFDNRPTRISSRRNVNMLQQEIRFNDSLSFLEAYRLRGWWRDVTQDFILLNVRRLRRFFENEEDFVVKKKKCVSKAWYLGGGGEEGRCMWLPTLVGYCTNRCDYSIKTFLSVSRGEGRILPILFFFSNSGG